MQLPEPLRPLRSRQFRIYWVGQAVSLVGTWMQMMAQNWVVTRLTASAVVVAGLSIAGSLPMAALGLFGGQVADRRSRRSILIVTQAVMMFLAFGLGALAFSGALALWHLVVFAALLGATAAFDLPAAQALAPELVPREDIPRAVALMQAVFHGSRLVGPAVAGILIDRLGEGSAFIANGVSFIAVILSLVAIRRDAPKVDSKGAKGRGGIGGGLVYVRGDPTALALLVLLLAAMTFAFPFLVVLMAYYARYVVHAAASGMGSIMSASGFGALTAALLLIVFGNRAWRLRIAVGVGLVGLALGGLGLNRSLTPAILLTSCLSLGISLQLGTIMQVIQQRVPNELRGRVMALFSMAFTSVMPLSGLILSLAADAFGLPHVMIACAVVFLVLGTLLASRLPRSDEPPSSAVTDAGVTT